jgi:uncharacterized membrane protein
MVAGEADKSRAAAREIGLAGIAVRRVPFDQPWHWLAAGWRDLWDQPAVSLLYGVIATACGLLLSVGLVMAGLESLIPVLAGGFLLIGPLLAVGLYEKSRSLAAGERPSMYRSARTAISLAGRLGLLAAILLVFYIVWVRVAILLVALFLGTGGIPPAREFMPMLLFTPHGLGLLVVGTAVGAVFAGIVFATTAISLPMLMERRVDAFTAMAASVAAVLDSPKAMALWAALIAGFIALGIATLGAALVIAFPLIGHATWHAYRDIVA